MHVVPPDGLGSALGADPSAVVPLVAASWLYGRGLRRLRALAGPGRGISLARALAFAGGIAALAAAVVSPLHALGETLLSAHMAQHALLVGVAPPLLLAGRPGAAWALALPGPWRRGLLGAGVLRWLGALGRTLSRPAPAAALHGVALWVWHAPALYGAAVERHWLHVLEHACFFGTALLFWRAVLDARAGRRVGPAVAATLFTLMHGGLLAGLITTAPAPLYGPYAGHGGLFGLTALEDQQLAGLLMWVPLGVPYVAAALWIVSGLAGAGPDLRRRANASTMGSHQGGWP